MGVFKQTPNSLNPWKCEVFRYAVSRYSRLYKEFSILNPYELTSFQLTFEPFSLK